MKSFDVVIIVSIIIIIICIVATLFLNYKEGSQCLSNPLAFGTEQITKSTGRELHCICYFETSPTERIILPFEVYNGSMRNLK